jgi:FlaG/FlaF family flagellin (archaellin)
MKLRKIGIRRNKKGVSTVVAAVLLISIIVVAALGAVMYLGGFDISGGTGGGSGGPFVGTLSITVVESNVLDPSATPSTTSDVYKIFGSRGKTLNEVTAADLVGGTTFTVGTAANFGVSQEDKGLLFMTVDAGSDYFEDSTSITSQNIGFSAAREMDIDGDNRMEYVYAVDVSSFDSAKETNVKQINIMVVQEDTSIALSSPSDQDSIGTGTKTGTIEWQITGIAEKYGGRLARIYVVSMIQPLKVNVLSNLSQSQVLEPLLDQQLILFLVTKLGTSILALQTIVNLLTQLCLNILQVELATWLLLLVGKHISLVLQMLRV